MAQKPKILAMAGSMRVGSYNKKLVRIAAEGSRKAGADVTVIDLNDYQLPLYHGDEEKAHGVPELAQKLKKLFIQHDGFLFSCPEYNSSVSGVFKNAIDWVSRPEKSDPFYLVAYKGKTAAIMSASPGALGGLRGLVHVRSLLENIGVMVIPDQLAVVKANEAFSEDGNLKDQKQLEKALGLGKQLNDLLVKLKH
jgi:NAD(P)H-dependent FMN reductase